MTDTGRAVSSTDAATEGRRIVSTHLRLALVPLALASTLAVGRVQAQQLTIPLQYVEMIRRLEARHYRRHQWRRAAALRVRYGLEHFQRRIQPRHLERHHPGHREQRYRFPVLLRQLSQVHRQAHAGADAQLLRPGATAGSPAVASLGASPGFQIGAVRNLHREWRPDVSQYFQSPNPPPHLGAFYGVFGAGNFRSAGGGGGVLGQAILPGVTQGYVVSANGPYNPPTRPNGPQGTQIVTIAGSQQPVSACDGLRDGRPHPQVIGQFVPAGPLAGGARRGVVPGVPGRAFSNPYGGATGNNGAREFGSTFKVVVTPTDRC